MNKKTPSPKRKFSHLNLPWHRKNKRTSVLFYICVFHTLHSLIGKFPIRQRTTCHCLFLYIKHCITFQSYVYGCLRGNTGISIGLPSPIICQLLLLAYYIQYMFYIKTQFKYLIFMTNCDIIFLLLMKEYQLTKTCKNQ